MAIYYFHIRDGRGVVPDEEGLDFCDLQAARVEARLSAFDISTAILRTGHGVGHGFIDIADRSGAILDAIPLRTILH